jgi:hypothetical protein
MRSLRDHFRGAWDHCPRSGVKKHHGNQHIAQNRDLIDNLPPYRKKVKFTS